MPRSLLQTRCSPSIKVAVENLAQRRGVKPAALLRQVVLHLTGQSDAEPSETAGQAAPGPRSSRITIRFSDREMKGSIGSLSPMALYALALSR